MKKQFLCVACMGILAYVVLSSRSGGAAANGLGNRTGSPGSNGTCASAGCHSGSGGFGTVSISITVKDAGGNTVTQYLPGQNYTLEYQVSHGSGSPVGYGMQSVLLRTGNTSIGGFGTPTTPNTRITANTFVEHNGINAAGLFRTGWTAPIAGTGPITVYAIGMATNGNGSTSGENVSVSTQLVLSENTTSIAYAASTLCSSDAPILPTISGTQGGTFTAQPAGLTLSSSTGQITPSSSAPGSYTITYTFAGGGTATANVVIVAAGSTSISYSDTLYCLPSTAQPAALINGLTGGTFSAQPAGLVFANAATGAINLQNSQAGNYTVTYIVSGNCPDTAQFALELQTCNAWETLLPDRSLRVYPNPFASVFYVEMPESTIGSVCTLTLYDARGSLIYSQVMLPMPGGAQAVRPEGDLPPGLYRLVVEQNGRRWVHTLMRG